MSTKDIISGLQVLEEINGTNNDGVCAEHDVIYITLDIPPRSFHANELIDSGWRRVESKNNLWWGYWL